jgi:hypothetical protein
VFVARSAGRALCNGSRQLKSPDRADAVVGVFGVGSGFANSLNRRFATAPSSDPMGALDHYYDAQPVEESVHPDQALLERIGGWTGG